MQPFCSSNIGHSATFEPFFFRISASTLMLPMSLTMRATFRFSCFRMLFKSVVLPEPKYPVMRMTGFLLFFIVLLLCLMDVTIRFLRVR